MAWLVCDAHVLASADIASTRRERRRGLTGRDSFEGALVIERCRWIHTFGMRFPIDVAYLDAAGTVLRTASIRPNRPATPVRHATTVIEAEAGAFERWGLHVGDQIEIRTDAADDR